MRRLSRREFMAMTAGVSAAALAAASCGDDEVEPAPRETGEVPSSPAATGPTVTPVADNAAVAIRWFGQSMFLLTSPGGTEFLLDPFGSIGYALPPPLAVDAATITHEHPDHNNDALAMTPARVLRGLTSEGWADIDETIGDVQVRTLRAYHDDQQGAVRGRNAIFVFEVAGLRIAHLGDLGHQLDDAQRAALGGPVDVLMVPTGGGFTIDPAGATELMTALRPAIVFPMHYRTPAISLPLAPLEDFTAGKTVQTVGANNIRISAAELPSEPTVMVLDYA